MQKQVIHKAIAVAFGVLLLPTATAAEDAARMQALEERLRVLEDRLEASEATVAAQREMIARGAPDVRQGGLDAFFNTLVIGGFVSTSYAYNFNNPDTNQGTNSLYQFNTDHNSFSLDAIKLELGRATPDPGMAGFQIDMLMGENANILGSATPAAGGRFFNSSTVSNRGPGDGEIFLQEAYAAYNYQGTTLKMGKWETLLGYEVIDSYLNPNITQGLLFTFAIPLYHTGLLASGNITEQISWAAGAANGFNNVNDWGDNKGVTGRIGYTQGPVGLMLNAFVGSERLRVDSLGTTVGDNNNRMQIYDFIATLAPAEGLIFWANVDYGFEELEAGLFDPGLTLPPDEDAQWFGVALGTKYNFTPKTSLALRGEFMRDDGGTRFVPAAAFIGAKDEIDATSATLTLAHQLTDNLMARAEYRHDTIDVQGSEDDLCNSASFPFFQHNGGCEDQQDVGIVQVNYVFD